MVFENYILMLGMDGINAFLLVVVQNMDIIQHI